jgi:hypothetical protein
MKNFIRSITAGLVVAGLLAACAPAFEPDLDVSYNLQKERSAVGKNIITVKSDSVSNTPLDIQPASGGYPQRIVLEVEGTEATLDDKINFDIENNKIPGLSIHSLTDAATDYAPFTESAALDYNAYPIAKNQVELVMPFNEAFLTTNHSTLLLVKLDPSQVTFNGKNVKLNQDGDSEPGEAEEDAGYFYYTNVQAPANYTGVAFAAPTKGVLRGDATITGYDSLTPKVSASGGVTLEIGPFAVASKGGYVSYSATPRAVFDASTLINAYKFQKYAPSTDTWNDLSPTPAFDTNTGTLSITFSSSAPGVQDLVRYLIDPYRIAANIKVGAAEIRADYNQYLYKDKEGKISLPSDDWTYLDPFDKDSPNPATPYLKIVTATTLGSPPSLQVEGSRGNYYLDLTVDYPVLANTGITSAENQKLNIASLTAEGNIKVFQRKGKSGNSGGDLVKEIEIDPSKITLKSANEFRLYLPEDYTKRTDEDSGIQVGNLEIRIYRGVSLSFRKDTPDTGDEVTAYFFRPNPDTGKFDATGSYRFEVKGPAN